MKKKLTPKQKKLASLTPPFNKITRGDIIKGATMRKKKNGSKTRNNKKKT